jgi:ATP synthase protein I
VIPTLSDRNNRRDPWADDADDAGDEPAKRLTREQAQALVANDPHSVSPWWVVAVQAAIGVLAALLAGALGMPGNVGWSALYGAAVVVVPGALMARGMTSKRSTSSPVASAASVMWWSLVKIGVSIAMLMLAPRLMQSVNWPALLATMVLCMQVYWFALIRRKR